MLGQRKEGLGGGRGAGYSNRNFKIRGQLLSFPPLPSTTRQSRRETKAYLVAK